MASKSLKVLILFDLMEPPPEDQDYSSYKKDDNWQCETAIARVLKRKGHEPKFFGVFDDIQPLIKELNENRPDLVFNLCEAFKNDRALEPNIVSLLELVGVPYTGCGPDALILCKDKGLTKKILKFHRVRVPNFMVSKQSRPLKKFKNVEFPVFVKPLGLEASEGIAQGSFCSNAEETIERVKFVHTKFKVDAIIEEYIEGRELYVSIVGNDRLLVFPPRELFFRKSEEVELNIATYKVKWDEKYRKKKGIWNGHARALPPEVEKKLGKVCKKIYQLFQMKGYGRIDLRVKENGDIVFLEANPNPFIGIAEDFAQSAKRGGYDYDALIDKIVSLSGA